MNSPLECKIKDGKLVISIGINVLDFATEQREPFTIFDFEANKYVQKWKVVDALEFAKDVARQFNREREDGSTPLTNLLDEMSIAALEQGSIGIEEVTTKSLIEEYSHD